MRQQTFINNKPTLYLVATPIGNLTEFTPRAIEVLNSVDIIGCEDTRTSKLLLNHFNINKPLKSYHKFNELSVVDEFIALLKEGKNIALISDAGYPLISDPGNILVNKAIEEDFNVTTISGACAFLNALVASGFDLTRFTFIGFLDAKSSKRKKQLEELKEKKETLIFYEAPHRVIETLQDMLFVLGDRKICLARELTKKFEEYIRGNISEVLNDTSNFKGEMVIVCEGLNKEIEIDFDIIREEIKKLVKEKKTNKDIVSYICDKYKIKKNIVYKEVMNINN